MMLPLVSLNFVSYQYKSRLRPITPGFGSWVDVVMSACQAGGLEFESKASASVLYSSVCALHGSAWACPSEAIRKQMQVMRV